MIPRPEKIHKDMLPYVEFLEAELRKYAESPYIDAYLTLLTFTTNSNKQIKEKPIDLFADKDQKEFERSHKYLTEMKPYYEQMEYFRKLMTPEQQKELNEKIKLEGLGTAEKMALKAKNG